MDEVVAILHFMADFMGHQTALGHMVVLLITLVHHLRGLMVGNLHTGMVRGVVIHNLKGRIRPVHTAKIKAKHTDDLIQKIILLGVSLIIVRM